MLAVLRVPESETAKIWREEAKKRGGIVYRSRIWPGTEQINEEDSQEIVQLPLTSELPECVEILFKDISKWYGDYHDVEDFAFLREDRTVMIGSISHDEVVFLMLRDSEYASLRECCDPSVFDSPLEGWSENLTKPAPLD